jgi:DNA-binding transcriptional LysR family regulator
VPSAGFYFLPQVIKRYHAEFPNIRVKIFDASANEVLAAVARGESDFGLNFIGSAEADLEFQVILEEPFVLACRRDHPLATRRSVAWSELRPYDFMTVGKSSGNRLLMDLALAGVPDRPVCIYEAQHVVTLLGLVEAGLGVAAVPRLAMPADDHPTLVSVPLKDPVITRRMGLIRRRGRSLSPAAQHLYAMFAELKKKRLPRKKAKAP